MSLKVNQGKVKIIFNEERLDNVLTVYKRDFSARLIDMIGEKPPELQGSEAPFNDVTILTIKQPDQLTSNSPILFKIRKIEKVTHIDGSRF